MTDKNQGEGNREAAREYNEQTQKFVKAGSVEEFAREAVQALDGAEAEELREAEAKGKAKALEEDPQVHRDK